MSEYNYEDTPAPAPKKKKGSRLDIWDTLSMLVLLVTACLVLYFAAIFIMPNSMINPFSPGSANALPPTPTPTITEIQLMPTWTITPQFGTETATFPPTITLEPSVTPFSLVTPSITPSPTQTPKAPFSATVTPIDSTIIHAEAGCNWQGVAGTVVDANNADMLGTTVRLTGSYNGRTKNELTVSGIAPAYGKSGFEFFLGTVPISTDDQLFIQILDQAGLPLSNQIAIDTFNDCSKNLTLVKFKRNP
jgi:hypothetical protein